MNGKINLVIETSGRVIQIPFKNIGSLDEFTSMYRDSYELVETLNKLLDLKIKNIYSFKVKVVNNYKTKRDNDIVYVSKELPVKYVYDNFSYDNLKEVYAKFYKDRHDRIRSVTNGIRNIKHEAIRKYLGLASDISDDEIDMAVNSYFKNSGYKKYRDAYFLLKENGYVVKTVESISKKVILDRTNLDNYEILDKYFLYLRSYAALGLEEHANAMDILSGFDSEEIKNLIRNSEYGLFDGEGIEKNEKRNLEDELLALQELTGKNYYKLKNLTEDNVKGHRR